MRAFWILATLIASLGTAQAQPLNLGFFMGHGFSDRLRWDGVGQETNTGQVLGVSISKELSFSPSIDVGVELANAKAEYSDNQPNTISGTSLMATAKHKIPIQDGIEAYVGLGLGLVDVTYNDEIVGYQNSEIELAAQATLGARYRITPDVGLFVEGRYIRSKDAHIAYSPATRDVDFRSKSVVIGLRKTFHTKLNF